MKEIFTLILLTTFKTSLCLDTKGIFEAINKKTEHFNAKAAEIAWLSSIEPDNPSIQYEAAKYQKERIAWQQSTCDQLGILHNSHLLNATQSRQTYLLCRGPKFTFNEARLVSNFYEELQTIYTEAEVCIETEENSSRNLSVAERAIEKHLQSLKYQIKDANSKLSDEFDTKSIANFKRDNICLRGEEDFQNLMEFSRNGAVLKWLWITWRDLVGPPMRVPYNKLVQIENVAAWRNGYSNIGASWRDELEIPNLRQFCRQLYDTVRPLYTLLHGIVRFYLRREYGSIVPERGPIPAHLLGDLWSQNWEPLADLILPKTLNLDKSIDKLNWTVHHMVKRAEDFYQSLGLPAMTDKFWNNSIFNRNVAQTRCHGAAADMFIKNDFRLIYCSGTTMQDFYVLHHELGHIHYYMAYEHQPALFRQANSAFHEAIGNTIMYGVLTPQHLNRLGLINDSLLYATTQVTGQIATQTDDAARKENMYYSPRNLKNSYDKGIKEQLNMYNAKDYNSPTIEETYEPIFDASDPAKIFYKKDIELNMQNEKSDVDITTGDILLLKQALNKIPQIPFSLLIDEFRWKYFEGDFTKLDSNEGFWQMALELQGIAPPVERRSKYFDVGAKFHVADNTPYIRYFLSSFIQHQLFEHVCKAAVFGHRGAKDPLPDSILLHYCDIYGSKSAGKMLKDIMSRGHSQHWQQILQETTGDSDISSAALQRYYRPLQQLLTKLVQRHRIPIGW